MNKRTEWRFFVFKEALLTLLLCFLLVTHGFAALNIAQTPVFLVPSTLPIVMLNMPKDHQLYFKIFDDYSDLDDDGIAETTYKHSFDYYGYFDTHKCYGYVNNRFEPVSITLTKYCSGHWSGNFLNWASMTRIDIIRKLLYGGLRVIDTAGETVLERSYLPNDAHSFAKFYKASDLAKLTPFSTREGITLCNTTFSDTHFSQDVTDPPLIRVAKGDYSLWAANERWQCLWQEDNRQIVNTDLNRGPKWGLVETGNDNNFYASGIFATDHNPSKVKDGLGVYDYTVQVKVCVDEGLIGNEHCKNYKNATTGIITLKPVGLLQIYGDDAKMRFGLMTGSYGKSKSGGVLRKNASVLTDEINTDTDGTFKVTPSNGGIINTLNKLRIYGYRHNGGTENTNGTYNKCIKNAENTAKDSCAYGIQPVGSDDCTWGLTGFNNGTCSNWGNPQSEIFLESLRYLSGQQATAAFIPAIDDSNRIKGLGKVPSVIDPISNTDYCAALNIIQFNAATSSYDADELGGVTDIGVSDVSVLTNTVGDGENITGGYYFVGENGINNNRLCTEKTVSALSKVLGICPEEPGLSGSYHISGLAHYAHTHDIRPNDRIGSQVVTTYGLALSHNKPRVVIKVPNSHQKITLMPACQNASIKGDCALVDFKITSHNNPFVKGHETGKLYVVWEDSEQGGDFDQDMWGIINYDYDVSRGEISITTDVITQSTPYVMGFGYIISGTQNQDGFHAHSGIHNFNYTDIGTNAGSPSLYRARCDACRDMEPATTMTYRIGNSTASNLQDPLYYAAKWGGFIDGNNNLNPDTQTEWDAVNNTTGLPPADGMPDQYFFSINPKQAEASLDKVLADAVKTVESSTSVVSNSSVINPNSLLFETKFDSSNWTGQVLAYSMTNKNVAVSATPDWDAGELLVSSETRSIFSYNPTLIGNKGIVFSYEQLSSAQQSTLTEDQLNYSRGDQNLVAFNAADSFRLKRHLLGDIVNSTPLYIGISNSGYQTLPGIEGSDYLNYMGATVSRVPMLAVGANDGFLHVFNASKNTATQKGGGKELLAYVPSTIMSNLPALTLPSYTAAGQHKYFVDGPAAVGDAYFDADNDNDNEWRTVLVGTLGAGGKGIFALDVTMFDSNNYTLTKPFTAHQVLWEINDQLAPNSSNLMDYTSNNANQPTQYGFTNNLGNTLGQASVVRMANGKFVAVFGNGYNSASQKAVLYIVDIKDGSLIRSISTDVGGDNGLSSPLAVDANDDNIVDAIYAGDLQGNLWKFDVSSNNPNDWTVAFNINNTPAPLFVAKRATELGQPITVKPVYAVHPDGGILLYFGTGSYFQTGDNIIGNNPQVQTFYGIWDECINYSDKMASCNTMPVASRDNLVAQTIDDEFLKGTVKGRQSSNNAVVYPIKKGWYVDLLNPPLPGTAVGEKVVSHALLSGRKIIFVTNTPNNASCGTGGDSWLMVLNYLTGARFAKTPFDLTGDDIIDDKDQISLTNQEVSIGASGRSSAGIQSAVVQVGDKVYAAGKGAGKPPTGTKLNNSVIGHRQSWVQLR